MASAIAALPLSGCGRGLDQIELFYEDVLVEAPTRHVEIIALSGKTCDEALSLQHEELKTGSGVLLAKTVRYPVNPEEELLKDLTPGQDVTFAVAGLDDALFQISRGCSTVSLDESESKTIRIELHALPPCSTPGNKLDVQLVIDTSIQMEFADPDRIHIPELLETVLNPQTVFPGTRWGVVTYGHNDQALELVPATDDLTAVRNAITSLENVHQGQPKLFDGLSKGTALLRSRAVCGFTPALVVIASTADDSSDRRFEDAQIGIFAGQADTRDDIFMFGLALHESGYKDLDDLIPDGERGIVTGAGSRSQIEMELRNARDALAGLVSAN